jgi:hypothetical protein
MLVNIIAAAAFMLLPYNLDYLTLLAAIASWLAWKVEGCRTSKGYRWAGWQRMTSPNPP